MCNRTKANGASLCIAPAPFKWFSPLNDSLLYVILSSGRPGSEEAVWVCVFSVWKIRRRVQDPEYCLRAAGDEERPLRSWSAPGVGFSTCESFPELRNYDCKDWSKTKKQKAGFNCSNQIKRQEFTLEVDRYLIIYINYFTWVVLQNISYHYIWKTNIILSTPL